MRKLDRGESCDGMAEARVALSWRRSIGFSRVVTAVAMNERGVGAPAEDHTEFRQAHLKEVRATLRAMGCRCYSQLLHIAHLILRALLPLSFLSSRRREKTRQT